MSPGALNYSFLICDDVRLMSCKVLSGPKYVSVIIVSVSSFGHSEQCTGTKQNYE